MAANDLGTEGAHSLFAQTIAEQFTGADVVIHPANYSAVALHADWPLSDKEKGPYSGDRSREITVKIGGEAVRTLIAGSPPERGEMLQRFAYTVRTRLADGSYNPQDPRHPPFIVSIDEESLRG